MSILSDLSHGSAALPQVISSTSYISSWLSHCRLHELEGGVSKLSGPSVQNLQRWQTPGPNVFIMLSLLPLSTPISTLSRNSRLRLAPKRVSSRGTRPGSTSHSNTAKNFWKINDKKLVCGASSWKKRSVH